MKENRNIKITPNPTPAEHQAILIALQTLLEQRAEDQKTSLSAWAAAGRHEVLRGLGGDEHAGWARPRDRVAGC